MRKSNQEITDHKVHREILSGAVICRIAMMDGNRPYLLPFNYGYREGCMYVHCAPEGKKIDLLSRDAEVCFEVTGTCRVVRGERACDWTTLYRSVVGYGTVEILRDAGEKRKGLEVIMDQHGSTGPHDFPDGQLERMVVLKLTIRSMTGKQSGNWDLFPEN